MSLSEYILLIMPNRKVYFRTQYLRLYVNIFGKLPQYKESGTKRIVPDFLLSTRQVKF